MRLSRSLEIPLRSEQEAQIVSDSIQVEPEVNENKSKRAVNVDGNILRVEMEAISLNILRTVTSAFMELVILVVKTLETFAPAESTMTQNLS